MAKKQPPKQIFGAYSFDGYINPPNEQRSDATRDKGKIAIFSNLKDESRKIYLTEKAILDGLMFSERAVNQGVYEGRPMAHVFNAVRAGLPVSPVLQTAPIKPEQLMMLLDGMYNKEVRPIVPFDNKPSTRDFS